MNIKTFTKNYALYKKRNTFVIISCCFIYAVLSFLCLRQKRVFDKDEFLFIIEFLSTNEFLLIIYFVYFYNNC